MYPKTTTIIRPLRHILINFIYIFFTKAPYEAPGGPDWRNNCTCTARTWGQRHETINRSLWYLVTKDIEEQDIVYGQTDGRPDDGQKGIA